MRATSVAFGATFFFLPLSKPLTYASLLAAIVLLTLAGVVRDEFRQQRFPAWGWPAAVLAVLPVASLLVHDPGFTGPQYLNLAYYWAIAVFTYVAARRMAISRWLVAFVAGTLVTFVYAQLKLYGLLSLPSEPPAVGNYILYSQFLALSVAVCSLLYRDEKQPVTRWLYLVAMLALLYGLITGMGRTGMLTVLVLAPFIVSNLLPNRPAWLLVAGSVLGIAILLSAPGVQLRIEAAVQDVEQLRAAETRTSSGYRLDMWRTAGSLVAANPVTGAGPGAFAQAWQQRFAAEPAFREPHNAYVFYASAYGLVALAALVALYGILAWTGWKRREQLAGGLVFAFAVTIVVGSITNTMFMGTASRIMLMLFIGLQGNMCRRAVGPALPAGKRVD